MRRGEGEGQSCHIPVIDIKSVLSPTRVSAEVLIHFCSLAPFPFAGIVMIRSSEDDVMNLDRNVVMVFATAVGYL